MNATTQTVDQDKLLLEVRRKLHVRAVSGVFARWRWTFVWLTQACFYGLPWLEWNERQAVLFDIASRKFHIFALVLYPQDFIYLTALLIVAAMSLFLFTTVAGRLWCGYACPQTVYTEIFMWLERRIEGSRSKRIKLDSASWSFEKLRLRLFKHSLWILVALWTGFTFVGYFTPIRVLGSQILTLSLGPWQLFWILFYAIATWGNAGFLREQVCKYMCPYARFQGVMFDRDTWVITYDPGRGEPRRSRSTQPVPPTQGDCVDCSLCVQVCPTGIDIRAGQQYECIGCAACIDACDQVMEKTGSAKGLIRYDTLNSMENGWDRAQAIRRILRPRVIVYSAILLTFTLALFVSIVHRVPVRIDVMRDRGALSREVNNGLIENVYQVMLINSAEFDRRFSLMARGLPTLSVDSETEISVPATSNRLIPVRLRATPDSGSTGSNAITLEVQATDDESVRKSAGTTFFLPDRLAQERNHGSY